MYIHVCIVCNIFRYVIYLSTYIKTLQLYHYTPIYVYIVYIHIQCTTDGDRLVSDPQTTISLSSVQKESSLLLWLTKETGRTS